MTTRRRVTWYFSDRSTTQGAVAVLCFVRAVGERERNCSDGAEGVVEERNAQDWEVRASAGPDVTAHAGESLVVLASLLPRLPSFHDPSDGPGRQL